MNILSKENLLLISNLAIKAGAKIMEHYQNNVEVKIKDDHSPLTKADLDSNAIIINFLKKIDHKIPILSEESFIDWKIRKNWNRYWLIDPLDGTKEFINKNGEFTVNIALVENNKPILGVIYAPVLSTLYYALIDYGAYKIQSSKKLDSLVNSKKINVKKKKYFEHLSVIGSRSHSNQEFDNWLKKNIQNYELIKKGSSLKFCKIADGSADIYPRFGPTSEWDIAAGHIILSEAGGNILDLDGEEIVYNTKEDILNPYFIASGMH